MRYNYISKNTGKDYIYYNRLRLIDKLNINTKSSPDMYAYYMKASLGIILIDC